jgi:hypothetical protein
VKVKQLKNSNRQVRLVTNKDDKAINILNKLPLGEYFYLTVGDVIYDAAEVSKDDPKYNVDPIKCRKVLRKNEWGTSIYVVEKERVRDGKRSYIYVPMTDIAAAIDDGIFYLSL